MAFRNHRSREMSPIYYNTPSILIGTNSVCDEPVTSPRAHTATDIFNLLDNPPVKRSGKKIDVPRLTRKTVKSGRKNFEVSNKRSVEEIR